MPDGSMRHKDASSGQGFDAIATAYSADAEKRGDRRCIFIPSARHYLGELCGKSVLELACGSGYFTRLIKTWGARSVCGVDLSSEMIDIARQAEMRAPLGIEYHTADVAALPKLGTFDLIFAAFLLYYAKSVEQLMAMCQAVSEALAPTGRFVTFGENPFRPIYEGIHYDVSVSPHGEVKDGTRITRTHHRDGQPIFSFDHYHYEPGTYEEALRQAGFSDIRWSPFVKGSDVDQGFPVGYWDDFLSGSSILVLGCSKPI